MACAAAFATPCDTPTLGAVAGVQRSHWQEFADGRSLLRERGTLRTVGLTLTARCAGIDWRAEWSAGQGSRAYDGITNTQAPLQTTSHLHTQQATLQGWLPVHEGWALGAQLAHRTIARDIDSVGVVRGYSERYRYAQMAAGVRYSVALAARWQLSATAWLGGGPQGRVRVQLPGFDTARLPLGNHRMAALSLELVGGAAPDERGWSAKAALSVQHERTAAGSVRTLTRSGVPAGAAMQPRFKQNHWGAQLQAVKRF